MRWTGHDTTERKPRKSWVKTFTTDWLDAWDDAGGWRKRIAAVISKVVPEDWGNWFSPNMEAIRKNRRFLDFEDEDLHILYDGLVAHGGDAGDEMLMEELEEEFSYRGLRETDRRCR